MTTTTGHCLCGQYNYDFDTDAVVSAHHCHCSDCRRITGGGKATIIMLPRAAFHSSGELKRFQVIGSDGAHVNREFCPTCGSQILSHVEEVPEMVFIKAGGLDDSSWVQVKSSFWSDSAQSWDPCDTSAPSSPGNPRPGEL